MKIYGYIFAAITITFLTFNWLGGRFLTTDQWLNAFLVVFLRFWGGVLFLLLLLPFFSKKKEISDIFFGKIPLLKNKTFWIASVALFFTLVFFIWWTQFSTWANTVLIQSLTPIIVALLTVWLHPQAKTEFSFRKIIFIVVGASVGSTLLLSDTSLLSVNGGDLKLYGDISAFISMIFFAIFTFFYVDLKRQYEWFNGLVITVAFLWIGLVLSSPAVILYYESLSNLTSTWIIFALLISIGSTGIAYLTWFYAWKYLNALMLSLLFNIVAVTTIIVEMLFYWSTAHEITYKLIFGWVLILVSAWYINFLQSKGRK